MNIPLSIVAGDSAAWLDASTKDNLGTIISSTDWVLTYALRGVAKLDLTGVAQGDGSWKVSMTTTQTADLSAGVYYWQAYASKGSERVTLGAGQMRVDPNVYASDKPFDGRTQSRKDLEAVQAAMRAMISGGAVAEYTIGNRQVRKMLLTDLMTLESQLKERVASEEAAQSIANGLGSPRKMFVRF